MNRLLRAAVLLAALVPAPSQAGAAAGQILFAIGRVEIQRGEQLLPATHGMQVEVGDKISTGPTGLTQLRFKDGALLALRQSSSMQVEDFKLPPVMPVATAPSLLLSVPRPPQPAEGGRTVMRLFRGAFRTITGLIGKGVADQYKVITPAATIGIRGTDYTAAYCESACGESEQGLYVGVSSGEVVLNNEGGELSIGNDEYGYVKDTNSTPQQETAPPEVLETKIEVQGETEQNQDDGSAPESGGTTGGEQESSTGSSESGSSESGATSSDSSSDASAPADVVAGDSGAPPPYSDPAGGGGAAPTAPVTIYQLQPGLPGLYAYAHSNLNGSSDNGVYLDDAGVDLTGFFQGQFVTIDTATNTNQGFDEASTLRWGRWSGGAASDGSQPLSLASSSLHWIYTLITDAPVIPMTGTASYSLVGNTNPTDTLGNVGFLGSATLSADFTNQTVNSAVNIGINNQVWNASGTGSISGALFGGVYLAVSVGGASGSGSFNGFFTDNAAAAGLSYSLSGAGTTVSGVAAFNQVGP